LLFHHAGLEEPAPSVIQGAQYGEKKLDSCFLRNDVLFVREKEDLLSSR
jgi:hypothetical protein